MRGLYVYGICAEPVRLRMRGVFRRQLRLVAVGGLHVIVESAARAPKPSLLNLKTQSRVVAALVAREIDVLPARFGAFVPDAAELRQRVHSRRPELSRALKLIKGRVQMTVRVRVEVSRTSSGAGTGGSGAAYLRAQVERARQRQREPLVKAIQRVAAPFARRSRLDWRPGPPPMAGVHHLVLRRRLARYEEAIARVLRERGGEGIISGPWAPFAFAEVA